ncbi:MAG: 4Fe-4S binding protein [Eubacteriales bacterium]|nr:4Fe-4S binding protein [Eubacteriales bacterium]
MASKRYAKVYEEICVACGTCIKVCPKFAINVPNGCFAVVEKEICIGCGKCKKVCPAECIGLEDRG